MKWIKKRLKMKKNFMDWNEYKDKIDFMDTFYWQQSVRRRNVK